MTGEPPILAEWRTGYAKLKAMPLHHRFPADFWHRMKIDLEHFAVCWGRRAADLGWSTLDVFGVDQASPYHRIDACGLLLLMGGRPILEMTADTAILNVRTPTHLHLPEQTTTFRKPLPAPGRLALWDLPQPATSQEDR